MPRPTPSVTQREARRQRRDAALALRDSMSPTAPAPDRLRVATWNLNSLRRRLVAVDRFLDRARPDVLCLQETKAAALSDEARALFERHRYGVHHVGAGAYNGVAVAAHHPIEDVVASGDFGDEHLDREPRLLSCLVRAPTPLRVASVVVAGDVNVAATDSDLFHPDAFRTSTHVTPRERAALTALLDVGLIDVDVAAWGPRARRFTWWNHGIGYSRNLGMRLDVIAAEASLADRLATTWIDHVERGAESPSDHAALIADFHLEPA